jgi:hypothetical protein
VSALLAPEEIAEGLAPNDRLGSGAFQVEVCRDHTVEATWDDQAAQFLFGSGGGKPLVVKQAVLAFSAAEVADTFVDVVAETVAACDPAAEAEDVPDVADRAVRISASAGGVVQVLLRKGSHVVHLWANSAAEAVDVDAVVDAELMSQLVAAVPE